MKSKIIAYRRIAFIEDGVKLYGIAEVELNKKNEIKRIVCEEATIKCLDPKGLKCVIDGIKESLKYPIIDLGIL